MTRILVMHNTRSTRFYKRERSPEPTLFIAHVLVKRHKLDATLLLNVKHPLDQLRCLMLANCKEVENFE